MEDIVLRRQRSSSFPVISGGSLIYTLMVKALAISLKIYLTRTLDLTEIAKKDIKEDYTNERPFCDGDIFRQLRFSQRQLNKADEGRWLARLSEGKRNDLRRFQGEQFRPVAEAFDELLHFVGLWPSLQIGTFHRILSLKCPEVSFKSCIMASS